MTFKFNSNFFFSLPAVLGITTKTFVEAIGVPRSTLFYYKKHGDIPIVRFVDACNKLRVSATRFIVPEGDEIVVPGNDGVMGGGVMIEAAEFKRIEYRPTEFGVFVTTCQMRTINDACEVLGIGYGRFKRNFIDALNYDGLMVGEFLDMCGKVDADPADYIVDGNCKRERKSEVSADDVIENKNKQIMDQQKKIKDLMSMINRLTMENKQLKEMLNYGSMLMVAENTERKEDGKYV